MAQLENTMNVSATYNNLTTTAQSTVIVELGNMTLIKAADQNPWVNGPLLYTVTLENIEVTGDITAIVFTDRIDITKSILDTSSVTLEGASLELGTGFDYDSTTGDLRIPYNEALATGEKITITFRVTKV